MGSIQSLSALSLALPIVTAVAPRKAAAVALAVDALRTITPGLSDKGYRAVGQLVNGAVNTVQTTAQTAGDVAAGSVKAGKDIAVATVAAPGKLARAAAAYAAVGTSTAQHAIDLFS